MHQFTLEVADGPGVLADVGEALGDAGVNIEGGFAIGGPSGSSLSILVENARRAREALEEAGLEIAAEREAIVHYLSGMDRPGTLGRLARRIAEAGVDIELAYVATGSRMVFVTTDNEKARAALKTL